MDDHSYGAAKTRLDVLDGVLDALGRMDEINAVVRGCADRVTATETLMAGPFRYPEFVAHHILDLMVGRQTVEGVEVLRQERDKAADHLRSLDNPLQM
jgi:DNA gyrase/topoisomerase IV subunit A